LQHQIQELIKSNQNAKFPALSEFVAELVYPENEITHYNVIKIKRFLENTSKKFHPQINSISFMLCFSEK